MNDEWIRYSPSIVTVADCLDSAGRYQQTGRMVMFSTETTLAGYDGRPFKMRPPLDAAPDDDFTTVLGMVEGNSRSVLCAVDLQDDGQFLVSPRKRVKGRVRIMTRGHFFTATRKSYVPGAAIPPLYSPRGPRSS